MPELPEVETIKRTLSKSLVGRTIKDVFVYTHKMIKVGPGNISNIKIGNPAQSRIFIKILRHKKIIKIDRRAKYLLVFFSDNIILLIHLRMSGQLLYREKKLLTTPLRLSLAKSGIEQLLPTKHTHIVFILDNGDKLFYNDTRQFGHLRLIRAEELRYIFEAAGLGPEPLRISWGAFKKILAKYPSKRAKDFLLDQSVIAGIGNIYADEALFFARISPWRKIGKLSGTESMQLHRGIQQILRAAIKSGGSSIENFLMTNGTAGKFSLHHQVYAKKGQPCPRCKTPLQAAKIGSRTATFCINCQK